MIYFLQYLREADAGVSKSEALMIDNVQNEIIKLAT